MTRSVARNLDEAQEMIKARHPFRMQTTGSPTLWAVDSPPSYIGKLPPEHADSLMTADYVVMSYATPIAWETDGEIVIPDVGYSPTTSQHQYTVKAAWDVPDHMWTPARGRTVRPAGGGPRRGGVDEL